MASGTFFGKSLHSITGKFWSDNLDLNFCIRLFKVKQEYIFQIIRPLGPKYFEILNMSKKIPLIDRSMVMNSIKQTMMPLERNIKKRRTNRRIWNQVVRTKNWILR